jgi:hypothetical protein
MIDEFEKEATHLVQQFVAQVAELARCAAFNVLTTAFGGQADHRDRDPKFATISPVDSGERTRAARRSARRRGHSARRSPAELESLSARFVSFVQANPGLRIEQINKQLGTETKELALPIRKLVSGGLLAALECGTDSWQALRRVQGGAADRRHAS